MHSHLFLMKHKRGLPYADDPRGLRPFSEKIRLQADAQALGYLNLYELTGKSLFLREAEDRLRYIRQLGDSIFSRFGLDGQIGYSFLRAYELTGDPEYLDYGLRVADRCLTYPDNVMNWGYLAALNLGKAWRLTGRQDYLAAARWTTRHTGNKQFPDGAFPHRGSRDYGENSPYTAWLLLEMILHRVDDPDDPDMDAGIIKGVRFLERRVNADGSLNYQDAAGTYDSDPGNRDSRGWMNELPAAACVLRALGRNEAVGRVLSFLFTHKMEGVNRGGYADKWGYPDPGNLWAEGGPSVLRTSLVFWFLTEIASIRKPGENGTSRPCRIAAGDCNAAFRELGLCDSGLAGHDVCINGRYTHCLDENLVWYRPGECVRILDCTYDADADVSRLRVCSAPGESKCLASACSDECIDLREPDCDDYLEQGDACGGRGTLVRSAPLAGRDEASSPVFVLDGIRPNPVTRELAVSFALPGGGPARIEVLDLMGRRVHRKDLGMPGPGRYQVPLEETARLPAGVYLVRLTQGTHTATRRAVVVR